MKIIQIWRYFSPLQKLGMIILVGLFAFGFLQPWYYPVDGAAQNLNAILQGSSRLHWFGTDHFGRDMLSRIAAAIRLSLGMVVVSVGLALVFGLLAGIVASLGTLYDKVLSFICDVIMALPGLLFVLLFAAIAPNSFWALYLGIALVMWVEFFKMARAIAKTLATSPQLESSRLMDMGFWYCIKRHYLPSLLPMLLPLAAYGAGNAILALATLGFINVGLRPPTAELGLMMTELFAYYYQAPWIFVQPIIVTLLLVLSFHLLSGNTQS
ncbi:ABC transporter permease [Moraxella marmotae]|uniref:ABC transporter permease n=1 Tax=Moraxella marmotae TaxID=3344520 RepID=UPI0035F34322